MSKELVIDTEREVAKKKLYEANTPGKVGDTKFYAIARGKTTGVVKGWDLAEPKIADCKKKVCYKAFDDEASAWAWLGDSKKKLQRKYKKTRKVTKTRPAPGGKKGEEEEYETDEDYFSYEDSSEEEVGKVKPKRPAPPPPKKIDEKTVNTSWMGSQKFTTDKQWLVEEEEKLVEDKKEVELGGTAVAKAYSIGQTLGSGGYSVVKLGKGKEQVALKILSAQMDPGFTVEKAQKEVSIIKSLKHPNIVSFAQSFELPDAVVIALELLEGGELLQTLQSRQNHSEDSARQLVSQLVSAVDYLHQNGVVHRDLVPENILFTKGEQSIKLVGFSVATKFTAGQNISFDGVVGTPALQPPEIIQRKDFNQSVDIWSIGILTYVLLSGYFPFQDSNVMKLNMKIRKAEFEFPDAEFKHVSDAGKNFIKEALKVDGRPSSSSVKSSAWLTNESNKKPLPSFATNLQKTVQSNAWNN